MSKYDKLLESPSETTTPPSEIEREAFGEDGRSDVQIIFPAAPPDTVVWEGKRLPVVREVEFSEKQYVDREVEITRRQIEAGLKDHDGQRLERSMRSAIWRYRGFVAGEIGSL